MAPPLPIILNLLKLNKLFYLGLGDYVCESVKLPLINMLFRSTHIYEIWCLRGSNNSKQTTAGFIYNLWWKQNSLGKEKMIKQKPFILVLAFPIISSVIYDKSLELSEFYFITYLSHRIIEVADQMLYLTEKHSVQWKALFKCKVLSVPYTILQIFSILTL